MQWLLDSIKVKREENKGIKNSNFIWNVEYQKLILKKPRFLNNFYLFIVKTK